MAKRTNPVVVATTWTELAASKATVMVELKGQGAAIIACADLVGDLAADDDGHLLTAGRLDPNASGRMGLAFFGLSGKVFARSVGGATTVIVTAY